MVTIVICLNIDFLNKLYILCSSVCFNTSCLCYDCAISSPDTHLKACKQVLPKNNSRTKRSNLTKFASWLTFSHINLSQKNHYKMNMFPVISKKAESWKKARGKPGTLTGVCLYERCEPLGEPDTSPIGHLAPGKIRHLAHGTLRPHGHFALIENISLHDWRRNQHVQNSYYI